MEAINTANSWGVSVQAGTGEIILLLPHMTRRLEPEEALRLAAWLVALADPTQERFRLVLDAVLNT